MITDFTVSVNWEGYTRDPILSRLEELDQKLKFAIWELMEYFGEEIGLDDPSEIIKLIRKSVDESISKYSPKDESFDEYYELDEESEDE